jgi:TonB family protein
MPGLMKRMAAVASAAVVMMFGVGVRGQAAPPARRATLPAHVQDVQDDFRKGAYTEDTADLVPPKLLRHGEPRYTPEAMRRKVQGNVVVDAVVAADGTVARVRIAESLDKDFGLDGEALKAVRAWKFEPGRLHGAAVPVLIKIVMAFRPG